jgi:GNAT superfamily N-acetyltransferase
MPSKQGGFASRRSGPLQRHQLPSRLPLGETAAGLLSDLLTHHGFYLVAAEQHGRIVGTNFLDGGSTIAGVGPITIDPLAQDSGVGTVLMTDVIERARCTGVAAAIAMTTNEPLGSAPGRIPVSTQ